MIIKSAEFIKSAAKLSQYPEHDLPEIVFSGKSNTGKSSLINTMLNRKKLAKTSKTPGRTQLINFFDINENFCFVDLPGYGYAKAPLKVREQWGKMIEQYLVSRKNLKCLILIMDIRRNKALDEQNFADWLKFKSIPYILTITKADKLSKKNQKEALIFYSETFNEKPENIILFSSKTRYGKDALWSAIEKYI